MEMWAARPHLILEVTLQFIYGTAWKKEATTELVKLAVSAGFKAIDTANQLKHYSESLVGDALLQLYQEGVQREQLFLQTKFTPVNSQGDNIPYDPTADFATQVRTSFQSSLTHLHTDYIDSYLLHGPYLARGLGSADLAVWKAIEDLYDTGKVKSIGVSNFNIEQMILLTHEARIKPMTVQNRCYARYGWDKEVRIFCKDNDIIYQGFSLLTANLEVLQHHRLHEIAARVGKTPAQVIFRFCLHIGIVPLTGTNDEIHMQQDLEVYHFELTADEVLEIERLGVHL